MVIYFVILLISAAALAFQVALTRFFSLAQGHHFAFMAISLALLGFGASGTYLSLRQPRQTNWRRILTGSTLLFSLSLPLAYLVTNLLPFDAYRIAWEPTQLLWLALYYLALTVPFFFGGLVIGTALAMQPEKAGPIYGANLLGSGLGPPLALLALATVGGPGAVFGCTLLGWLAVISSQTKQSSLRTTHYAPLMFYLAVTIALVYLTFYPPALFNVQLTPYKPLAQAQLYPNSEIIFSEWNAFSRVDVLQSEGTRSAPGLSFTFPGQLPPQLALTIDGDNLSPISHPTDSTFTQYLPLTLAFKLRPQADTLILEPGGGLAVLTALQNGARSVTVVQSNYTAAQVVATQFDEFSGNLYDDPRVTVIIDEPRSFLRRTRQQFDLIILPLTDSFRPVTAGAYTLSEDYRYTVQATVDALGHLSPEGLLVAERWLQLPPSESLRLWGTLSEGLRRSNATSTSSDELAEHLLAIRSLQTSLMAVSPSPLLAEDIVATRNFSADHQFDLVWLPDIQPDEVNRYSVVPDAAYYRTFSKLLTSPNPDDFYATYPHAIAPPTDDHPYFFHFFRWGQTPEILQTLGKTWQPFGGSGYLVLVVLLGLVLTLSIGLILLPLIWMKDDTKSLMETEERESPLNPQPSTLQTRLRYLLYFTLLGLGFLFVEVSLLQRFILYLGQPAYAFAVVVAVLLVAAGVGSSYLSAQLPLKFALPLVAILTLIYPLLLPLLFDATLRFPFVARVALTALALFPLGVVLGVPFPRGIALVGRTTPQLTPWVWAVNGCASVVSAVLAAMIALTWSFSAVLWSAAAAYALAAVVIRESPPSSTSAINSNTGTNA